MIDYKNYLMEQPKKSIRNSLIAAGAIGIIIAAMVTSCVQGLDKTIEIEEQKNAPLREQRERIMKGDHLTDAFQSAGSPDPHLMAKAVNATKRPELMAAIALQESDGTPWAKGKAGEKGAFQVIEKDWKIKVSDNPTEQALQAEKILDELLEASKGDVKKALSMYNGGSRPPKKSYKYADSVIAKWKKLKGEVSGKNS